MAKKFKRDSKSAKGNSKPKGPVLSRTIGRHGAFQHPALIKLGEGICANYETSLNEAKEDLILRRQHEHEARKTALYAALKAATDEGLDGPEHLSCPALAACTYAILEQGLAS